jgi:hypothetical protein
MFAVHHCSLELDYLSDSAAMDNRLQYHCRVL